MNCGKYGHNLKSCIESVTSCGIICFHINLPNYKIEKFLFNKFLSIEDFNYQNIHYIDKINFHDTKIKFLLIQRKHSFSYIEFLRGLYKETDEYKIKSLFSLMSKSEIQLIKDNDFQTLWFNLWQKNKSKTFIKEMNTSMKKFNYLKSKNLIDYESEYDTPEWGFPKGRRNKYENNLDCANREFKEETNMTNYNLFERIGIMEEKFTGTNNINYRQIYYLASIETEYLVDMEDNYEIGNIGWYNIDDALKLIRPYDKTKLNMLNQLYFFLSILQKKIIENSSLRFKLSAKTSNAV
jgi:8-oxo-dGTP pyrophosphatase MutT (NUDIX family)